jgi:hypothetical protein
MWSFLDSYGKIQSLKGEFSGGVPFEKANVSICTRPVSVGYLL